MEQFAILASDDAVTKTVAGLQAHGIQVTVVETAEEAKAKVQELIPAQSEVLTMTSKTLEATGVNSLINESGQYNSVRNQLNSMDRATQSREMRKLGAAPDYALGSVHAVTETGELFIASATGSQLGAYAYAAEKVIWVVGTHKIVADKETAMTRIYDYVLPQEKERALAAYGSNATSNVNKLLVINTEVQPERLHVILVKEKLGF